MYSRLSNYNIYMEHFAMIHKVNPTLSRVVEGYRKLTGWNLTGLNDCSRCIIKAYWFLLHGLSTHLIVIISTHQGRTKCSTVGHLLSWYQKPKVPLIKSAQHDPQHHPPKFCQTHSDFGCKSLVIFSDFWGEIWFEYSKYLRRNQQICCLEMIKCGHHTN